MISSTFAQAQARVTLYYSKAWILTTKDSAVFTRTAIYDTVDYDFSGPVTDTYRRGTPQMEGTYKRGLKHGEFTFYYENGQVESAGQFEDGERTGVWKYYYPNGKPKQEVEYAPVLGNDPIVVFLNDSTGAPLLRNGTGEWREVVDLAGGRRLIVTGEYKNHEKNGKWECRSTQSKNRITEHFKNGRFVSGVVKIGGLSTLTYEPQHYSLQVPDKLPVTEGFFAGNHIDFKTYPQLKLLMHGTEPSVNYIWDEGELVYLRTETAAAPPGNIDEMYSFFSDNMGYPEIARELGIQGRVYVEFVVNKDGGLRRFKVVKGIGGGCDEEVIRVFEEYAEKHKWKPGLYNGVPVKQLVLMSLLFQAE